MAIRFHCEACDARIKVPEGSQKRKVKCPRCEHLQRVPAHAQELVAVGGGAGSSFEDRFAEDSQDSGETGSFEANPEQPHHHPYGESSPKSGDTSPPSISRKSGIEVGDSLADLTQSIVKDAAPPVPSTPVARAVSPAPKPAAPKPIPMSGSLAPKVETKVATEPAPSPITPQASSPSSHPALKNLATALRIIPAFLIPVVLWHILSAATLSVMMVTLISGIAIVAITWTLAEIADTLRNLADRSPV